MRLLLIVPLFISNLYGGWYSAELLSIEVGGRASAMGGAYTAIAKGGFSSWWNPSRMVENEKRWVAVMYSQMFGAQEFNFVGLGYPRGKFCFSLSAAYIEIDSIPALPETFVPHPIGVFSHRELGAIISCGYKVTKSVGIGVNVKYLDYNLYNIQARGGGIDFGAYWKRNNLVVGVVVKDVGGTTIKWETGREDFKQTNMRAGIGYKRSNFIASLDAGYEYGPVFCAGIEYYLKQLLFLRLGINKGIVGGIGVEVRGIILDYAYSPHGLGALHKVSLQIEF
jgi:hypothetical protein